MDSSEQYDVLARQSIREVDVQFAVIGPLHQTPDMQKL